MASDIDEAGMNLPEAALQPAHSSASLGVNDVAVLSVAALHKSDKDVDEEENEVDRMIQLSGMIYSDLQINR